MGESDLIAGSDEVLLRIMNGEVNVPGEVVPEETEGQFKREKKDAVRKERIFFVGQSVVDPNEVAFGIGFEGG